MTPEQLVARVRKHQAAIARLIREFLSQTNPTIGLPTDVADLDGKILLDDVATTSSPTVAPPSDVGTRVAQITRTYVQDLVPSCDPVLPSTAFDLIGDPPNDVGATSSLQNLFAEFWAAYPRRVAKQDALRAFRKLNPTPGLVAYLIQAIEKQQASKHWQDGFVPNPATWLNGQRWTDDLDTIPVAITGPMTRNERVSARNKQTLAILLEAYGHDADPDLGGGGESRALNADDRHAGGDVRRGSKP